MVVTIAETPKCIGIFTQNRPYVVLYMVVTMADNGNHGNLMIVNFTKHCPNMVQYIVATLVEAPKS